MIDTDKISEAFNEHLWVRVVVYSSATIAGIWVLGHVSKILTGAVINFKSLHHAITS